MYKPHPLSTGPTHSGLIYLSQGAEPIPGVTPDEGPAHLRATEKTDNQSASPGIQTNNLRTVRPVMKTTLSSGKEE